MTDLRYRPNADGVTAFGATVTEATAAYVVLGGTYFYPAGGGQPADHDRRSRDGGQASVREVRTNHGDFDAADVATIDRKARTLRSSAALTGHSRAV